MRSKRPALLVSAFAGALLPLCVLPAVLYPLTTRVLGWLVEKYLEVAN